MKIRVETETTEEVDELLKRLEKDYTVQSRSREYPNRYGSLKRTYVELSKK